MISRRSTLALLSAAPVAALFRPSRGLALPRLVTHDAEAGPLLTRALTDSSFWKSGTVQRYTDRLYDEVRLVELDEGYLARVSGEGGRDFKFETVVSTIFDNMQRLPEVEDGAMAVERLGEGTDPLVGLPFVDSFYYLDFTLFYGTYAQRMYKLIDDERTILYFEQLRPPVAGSRWSTYQARIDEVVARVDRRALFNAIVPVSQVFGMFVVEPGQRYSTRVSFTTKIHFGAGTGFIARVGSQMPPVIKAGLRSGFESCVAIANMLEPA
ncbi:MAG: hypothetical protein D6798_02770 [Deltaproteobacteria bacterium]|nr:MAG: hypothetical protein D6798_02770 [Deltaproteobacteria bacterium]